MRDRQYEYLHERQVSPSPQVQHVARNAGRRVHHAPTEHSRETFGQLLESDGITFSVMWWVLGADSVARQILFQSGWFVVGLLTQTLVLHLVRTPKLPFVQSRASAPLLGMTLAIMAVGLWLPLGPLAGYFKLQALPWAYYGWLVAILIGYCALTTLMKRVCIRRFGWQ